MSGRRKEIKTPREGKDGKTYWTKIGSAFESDSGDWSLVFDALPIPTTGRDGKIEVRARLMDPYEDRNKGNARQPRDGGDDLGGGESEIPF